MHILLIHQAFVELEEPGGTRHYELARCLTERGHQVTVIASSVSYLTGKVEPAGSSYSDSCGKAENLRILRAYTYSALHRSFVHRIFSFLSFMISSFIIGLNVKEVDLVWGTSPPIFQSATAWLLARVKRIPFLLEVRDLWPAFAIQVGVLRNRLIIKASEWLEGFLYRHADRVMVNSPGYIDHVKLSGAQKIDLVPNGSDVQMFDPFTSGTDFRKANGLEGKFIALYAGAHGMSNDLGIVLQAAHYLSDSPEIAIVFVGDGKDKPCLINQAAEMGLVNVYFLPPVPKIKMGEVLAAADACIAILKPIPLYSTVFPNKVFDYMAAGRPIILAIDGVIREEVEKAGAGIFVPPGDIKGLADAIQYLEHDREARISMGQRGRLHVEAHFDRVSLAEKLAAIMEQMV